MYFDWTYLVLILPAVLFSLWAARSVDNTYRKYRKCTTLRGITGAEAARAVLRENGLSHLPVLPISGELTDHYDPKRQVVCLSAAVYDGTDVAAIGIACHEVGHAIQHAVGYRPLRLRTAIVPITNIGSRLSAPLILLGVIFSSISTIFTSVAYIGIACFALSTVFQLITLPTEFNASARAMSSIRSLSLLREEEAKQAQRVLRAAAMTYVAALAVSLTELLRLVLIVNRSRRR